MGLLSPSCSLFAVLAPPTPGPARRSGRPLELRKAICCSTTGREVSGLPSIPPVACGSIGGVSQQHQKLHDAGTAQRCEGGGTRAEQMKAAARAKRPQGKSNQDSALTRLATKAPIPVNPSARPGAVSTSATPILGDRSRGYCTLLCGKVEQEASQGRVAEVAEPRQITRVLQNRLGCPGTPPGRPRKSRKTKG
jgi:hypothetical protein